MQALHLFIQNSMRGLFACTKGIYPKYLVVLLPAKLAPGAKPLQTRICVTLDRVLSDRKVYQVWDSQNQRPKFWLFGASDARVRHRNGFGFLAPPPQESRLCSWLFLFYIGSRKLWLTITGRFIWWTNNIPSHAWLFFVLHVFSYLYKQYRCENTSVPSQFSLVLAENRLRWVSRL